MVQFSWTREVSRLLGKGVFRRKEAESETSPKVSVLQLKIRNMQTTSESHQKASIGLDRIMQSLL